MNVTLPDSLKDFLERVSRGEPLPIDEHFHRRMETLLDEAEKSGDHIGASKEDFDAMEREAQDLVHKRKS